MASNVLYGNMTFTPYFDMSKFENKVYNKDILREQRIKSRRKQKVLDNILLFFVIILSIAFIFISALVVYQYVGIVKTDYKIEKLEKSLKKKKEDIARKTTDLSKIVKYEDLKMKAYLELNMILPTDKNIIYFDKSDQGFVRQYESIH